MSTINQAAIFAILLLLLLLSSDIQPRDIQNSRQAMFSTLKWHIRYRNGSTCGSAGLLIMSAAVNYCENPVKWASNRVNDINIANEGTIISHERKHTQTYREMDAVTNTKHHRYRALPEPGTKELSKMAMVSNSHAKWMNKRRLLSFS